MGTKEILRTAIIGCGEIAMIHIPAILRAKRVVLVAVCDVNEDLAKQMARRFNISSYYTNFTELLSKERVDVVHITTPPHTHLTLSTQAMEAGCHVFVEKPTALNLNEAERMIEAARTNRVRLCVAHNMLFQPVVIRVKSMIEKGVVGDLTGMSIIHSLPRQSDLILNKEHWCHQLPGGIFGEMLPHPIYLAIAFLGGLEATAVYSQKLSSYEWLVADELRVILKGKNSVATIIMSVNGMRDIIALDIFGTKKSLHVNISNGVMISYIGTQRNRLSRGLENIQSASRLFFDTASAALNFALRRYHDGHYTLLQKFYESLQNNTELPVTVDEAREVMRLYQAITSQIKARSAVV